jgi:hypothetical protein
MYSLEPSYPQEGVSHSDPPAVIRLTAVNGFAVVFMSRSYFSVAPPQPQQVFKCTLNWSAYGATLGQGVYPTQMFVLTSRSFLSPCG